MQLCCQLGGNLVVHQGGGVLGSLGMSDDASIREDATPLAAE